MREVWLEEKQDQAKPEYGMYEFVAGKVRKTKKGKPTGDHPTNTSIKDFFTNIDKDPEWYPGKHCGGTRGPEPILKGGN